MNVSRPNLLANLGLIGGWLWVHGASVGWLIASLGRPGSELNAVLALGLLWLLSRRVGFRQVYGRLCVAPESNPLAAALVLVGALGVLQSTVALWPFYALSTGVGGYGLLGLYLSPGVWRRARPIAVLAILLMPMAEYLDVYLGFPARRLTAGLVSSLLGALDISHISAGFVLQLEGGAAYVDLPCAGVRSLWTGTVFLLAAAVLEKRTVDAWFLGTGLLFSLLLLAANTARVAVIVLLAFVADQPLLAEVLHAPMGVIGFAGCCALAWGVLSIAPQVEIPRCRSRRGRWPWGLVGALLVIGNLSGSPEISVVGEEVSAPALPEGLDPIPLTEAERAFARQRGGAIAKGRFRRGDLTGTVVLVRSRSWLAQHLPRHCLRSAGVDVSGEAPVMVDGDPVRWAETTSSVGVGRAAWWFQSGDSRTDDHTERIWMGMGEDRPWTMVSILFDQPLQPDNPEATSIIVQLRALESS